MNNTINKLQTYINKYKEEFFDKPKILLVTREELQNVYNDNACYTTRFYAYENKPELILGFPFKVSHYAEVNRTKVIDMKIHRVGIEHSIDEFELITNSHERRDEVTGHLIKSLIAYVASDTTCIKIIVEHDPWAWLKRKWKWFGNKYPVIKREIIIEGTIIYPHLEVKLPDNLHTVKLKVRI